MPIDVKDASGATVEVPLLTDTGIPATAGQKAMAGSLGVAIASDQSAVPVSASSLPLPTGAAAEATLGSVLTTLASILTELGAKTEPGDTQPVSGPLTDGQLRASAVPVSPGTKPTWVVSTGNTAHVAAARTTLLDLFNASGSGVTLKVRGIFIQPALVAVAGVGQTYEIIRTSAVGTGGSTLTPAKYDTASSSLHANITARSKPTGGATTDATLLYVNGSSEETTPYAGLASILNHLKGFDTPAIEPIVLREGYGLKIDQTTNSSIGNVNVAVLFTVE